jgi:hypothetical protein
MNFETALQIASLLFGVGGIGSFFLSMRRTQAQNDLDISTAWEKFSAPLLKRIDDLETKMQSQERTIIYLRQLVSDLRGWAERLARQVIDLGGQPVPFISRRMDDTTTEYPIDD